MRGTIRIVMDDLLFDNDAMNCGNAQAVNPMVEQIQAPSHRCQDIILQEKETLYFYLVTEKRQGCEISFFQDDRRSS